MPIRGNVNTRMRKLDAGDVDALVLALCGLERLGEAGRAVEILSRQAMLPAVGQGALAIECRAADEMVRQLVEPLHDAISAACVGAERAMLATLDGSCRTPIAGLAEIEGGRLRLEGLLLKPDGSDEIRGRREGVSATRRHLEPSCVASCDAGRAPVSGSANPTRSSVRASCLVGEPLRAPSPARTSDLVDPRTANRSSPHEPSCHRESV